MLGIRTTGIDLGVTSNWEASCLRNMLSLAFCHISGICHILGNMSQFGNTLNREASCHRNMSSQATCHLSGIFRIGIFQIGINHTEAICQIMVYYILGSLHIRFTHISMRREMRMQQKNRQQIKTVSILLECYIRSMIDFNYNVFEANHAVLNGQKSLPAEQIHSFFLCSVKHENRDKKSAGSSLRFLTAYCCVHKFYVRQSMNTTDVHVLMLICSYEFHRLMALQEAAHLLQYSCNVGCRGGGGLQL